MASSRSSEIAFATDRGEPVDRPAEWVKALVVLSCELTSMGSVEVHRNDTRLAVSARQIGGTSRVVAEWPRANAGNYTIFIAGIPGQADQEIGLTISPARLTDAELARIVQDLQEDLPASLAFALSRRGATAGLRMLPPGLATPEQELDHLRRAVMGSPGKPGLTRLLASIARQPHQVLESGVRWTSAEAARQIHPAAVAQVYSRPGNIGADAGPVSVPERQVRHTSDVYENQVVRLYAEQVANRLRALGALGSRAGVTDQVKELLRALTAARRGAVFLDSVTTLATAPSQITTTLIQRPDYRAIYQGLLDLQRRAVLRTDLPDSDAALADVPRLYERWTTGQALVATLHAADRCGYVLDHFDLIRRRREHELVVDLLRGGNTPLAQWSNAERGTKMKLFIQRVYMPDAEGLHSISFQQKPDIAVEVSGAKETAVVIFDAKYKLRGEEDGRPAKSDIDTMHAYSDAIRDGAARRVVRSASVLFPGESDTYGKQIAAIRARPGEREQLAADLQERLLPVLEAAR
jgi:hypothetical protein